MYVKKLMQKKNLKKFKKLTLFYLMKIKEDNMINLDMLHLMVHQMVQDLIFQIYLKKCLVVASVLVVEAVIDQLEVKI